MREKGGAIRQSGRHKVSEFKPVHFEVNQSPNLPKEESYEEIFCTYFVRYSDDINNSFCSSSGELL